MSSSSPLRVAVAGGGFAAAEALLATRAFAGDRVSLELITPDTGLAFRPAATTAAFTGEPVATYDLAALAEATGATLRHDVVEAVAPAARRLRLASGAYADYDALILAVGARARNAVPGAVTLRDHRDAGRVAALIEQLRTGNLRRLALTAPAGVVWTLPLYELALYAAGELGRRGLDGEVTIVTPERRPLEVFGRTVSDEVSDLLVDQGVRLITATRPEHADRHGLRLGFGGTIPVDATIAVPALTGRRVAGVPSHDFSGFVQTDASGRVVGLDRVWAAGDMTTCRLKQGGVAAQQAEAAAADVASLAGASVRRPERTLVLRAKLVGGPKPLFLRAELDGHEQAVHSGSVASDDPPWWPDAKVFGRHVTPWMAMQASADRPPPLASAARS